MNGGIGALGPFNTANSTIGRFWTLISKNLGGGGKLGETYLGSQGTSHNFSNILFPEKEDRLPEGWKPFHVQKGYDAGESVVSTFTGWNMIHSGGFTAKHSEVLKRAMTPFGARATFLLDPIVANDLKDYENFETKEQISEWLMKNAGTRPKLNPEGSIEIILVGGETNPFFLVGDFGRLSSASVDTWR